VSAIVKETVAGRKNSSPQTTYETTQLYAAGALKVAVIGLQCVGFNQEVYQSVVEYSVRFGENKWKSIAAAASSSSSSVEASPAITSASAGVVSGASTPIMTPIPATASVATRHASRPQSYLGSRPTSSNASPINSGHYKGPSLPITIHQTQGLGLGSSIWNMTANCNSGASAFAAAGIKVPIGTAPMPPAGAVPPKKTLWTVGEAGRSCEVSENVGKI